VEEGGRRAVRPGDGQSGASRGRGGRVERRGVEAARQHVEEAGRRVDRADDRAASRRRQQRQFKKCGEV
jgi:hypothetical protein